MIGDGALLSGFSYVAVGKETTFGTYNTCTAMLEPTAFNLKMTKESKVLDQISMDRVMSRHVSLSRKLEGDVEFPLNVDDLAINYLFQNALGGAVTSATATGETLGAGANSAMTHTYPIGYLANSCSSLCFNVRKGDATNGKVYQYSGIRVNELGISSEIGDVVKIKASLKGKDATINSNSVSAAISATSGEPLVFSNGRISVGASVTALTSTTYWAVQSIEFSIANNLKDGNEVRSIGSETVNTLVPGKLDISLKCKMRFDTTTAYDAMMAHTQYAAQLEFLGTTLPSSSIRRGLRIDLAKIYIEDAGDPTIGGPDEILTSEITFKCLKDISSSTGYAMKAYVTNQTASY